MIKKYTFLLLAFVILFLGCQKDAIPDLPEIEIPNDLDENGNSVEFFNIKAGKYNRTFYDPFIFIMNETNIRAEGLSYIMNFRD